MGSTGGRGPVNDPADCLSGCPATGKPFNGTYKNIMIRDLRGVQLVHHGRNRGGDRVFLTRREIPAPVHAAGPARWAGPDTNKTET